MAQRIKHLPAMQETRVQSLGWEDPLEKEIATHSSILVWRIPWTEEPGELQSTGPQRVGHDWATLLHTEVSHSWCVSINVIAQKIHWSSLPTCNHRLLSHMGSQLSSFGFFSSFWPCCHVTCEISVPWPGIECRLSAVKVQSPNPGLRGNPLLWTPSTTSAPHGLPADYLQTSTKTLSWVFPIRLHKLMSP